MMKKGDEETLVIIKNESIKRGLVGKIIEKFEDASLEITQMQMLKPSKRLAKKHYTADEDWKLRVGKRALDSFDNLKEAKKYLGLANPKKIGSKIYEWSVSQLVEKSVIVLVVKGTNAIDKVKEITGFQEPSKANLSSLRGIF